MKQYKVIHYYVDAPGLCGEVYRSPSQPNSNIYSYNEALAMIELCRQSYAKDKTVDFRVEETV